MSVPVAGRRKGVAPPPDAAVATSSPPANAPWLAGGPSWLDDGDHRDTLGMGTSPSATQPLSSAAASGTQDGASSPQGASHHAPSGGLAPDFLDFLSAGGERGPRMGDRTTTTTTAVASVYEVPPAFLADDSFGTTAGLLRTEGQPAATTRGDEDARQTLWHALKTELQQVNRETRASVQTIAALESGEHELCKDVEELTAQLAVIATKEQDALQTKREAQRLVDEQASSLQGERADSLAETERSIRSDLEEKHKAALAQHQLDVEEQASSLAAARAALEEMQRGMGDASATDRLNAGAIDQLQSALSTLMSSTRRDVALQLKPLLARSIREQMQGAALQRRDIFTADQQERLQLLEDFRRKQDGTRQLFVEEQRARMQKRRDAVFGSLKQHFRSEAEAHTQDMQRRLGAYRAQVAESVLSLRRATEASMADLTAAAERTTTEMEAMCARELTRFVEEKQMQLQLVRERTQAEKRNLSLALRRHSGGVDDQGREAGSTGALPASLQVTAEDLRSRMDRVRLTATAEANALQERRQRRRTGRELDSREQRHHLDAEAAMQASTREVALELSRFQRDVEASQQTVAKAKKMLAEKRARLSVLHDAADRTRRNWESEVRRALTGAFVSSPDSLAGNAIPQKDELLAEALETLTTSVATVHQRQQQVSEARFGLYQKLQANSAELQRQRGPVDAALRAVFDAFEKLRSTSSALEALDRVMELTTADAAATRAQLVQERARVVSQQGQLAALAAQLQNDSTLLEREEAKAKRRKTRVCEEQDSLRATLAVLSTTPLPPLTEVDTNYHPQLLTKPLRNEQRSGGRDASQAAHDTPASQLSPSPVSPPLGERGRTEQHQSRRLDYHYHHNASHRQVNAYNSPRGSLRTTSEFSTDLITLGEDSSSDEIVALQTALGLNSLPATQPPLDSGIHRRDHPPPATFTTAGSETSPRPADTTRLGRSLTTPSSSN